MNKICKFSFLVSIAGIFVGLLVFYGVDNEHKAFFKYGKGVRDEYLTIYHKQVYHYGVMVSEPAAIAVLTIVFGLISWIIHEAVLENVK